MSVRSRLFLQSAVVVNAVVLIAGLICYQSGLLFPASAVTQEDLNAAIEARRSVEPQVSQNVEGDQTVLSPAANVEQSVHPLNDVAKTINNGYSSEDVVDSTDLVVSNVVVVQQPNYEEMRRRPGPASPELILHDSVNFSSSKSIVIAPRTTEEKQKMADRMVSSATSSFRSLDRDHDDQLTEREVGEQYWKLFEEGRAVSDGKLSFDGFLKNYVRYKFRIDIHNK